MAQSFTNHTYYKVYDGTVWKIISFKTDVADVGVNASRKFVTTSVKVNNVAFTLGSGSSEEATLTLYGTDIKLSNATGASTLTAAINGKQNASDGLNAFNTLISQDDTTGLVKLTGENSFELVDPSTLVTAVKTLNTNNTTAQTVSSSETISGSGTINLHKIAKTGTFGDLLGKPTTISGYGITDAVSTSRTINSKALSSNITLYGTDIAMSSSDNTTLKTAIDNVVAVANGKTKTYVISDAAVSGAVNADFNSQSDDISKTLTSNIRLYGASSNVALSSLNLKLGDVLLVKETEVPDRWVSAIDSGGVTFSKLETTKVTVPTKTSDLTNDSNFITGITSSMVTTALGYTPYNSTNPNGYTTNTGTVTSVTIKAGTGLSSSSTSAITTSGERTISIASGYKLPTTTEWAAKLSSISYYLNGAALDEFDGKSIGLTAAGGTNITTGTTASGYTIKTPTYIIGTAAMDSPIKGDIWFDTNP